MTTLSRKLLKFDCSPFNAERSRAYLGFLLGLVIQNLEPLSILLRIFRIRVH